MHKHPEIQCLPNADFSGNGVTLKIFTVSYMHNFYLIIVEFEFKCASKNEGFASGQLVNPEFTLCLKFSKALANQ